MCIPQFILKLLFQLVELSQNRFFIFNFINEDGKSGLNGKKKQKKKNQINLNRDLYQVTFPF